MGWRGSWQAIAARVDGLTRATELFAATLKGADNFDIQSRGIIPELQAIRRELVAFMRAYKAELPLEAQNAILRFTGSDIHSAPPASQNAITFVVPLSLLRTEFEYLIRDQHDEARSLTELAFAHLRRLIAVDDDVRRKWRAAFDAGETSCERVGAVHLLSHGIFAFKMVTADAATDLVYGNPIERHTAEIQRTARALVVTEWKRITDVRDVNTAAEVAQKQLKLYSRGPLAELTLTQTRFAVLVTKQGIEPPPDVVEGGVLYRHIAIAVDPASPSVEARARARRTRR